MLPGESIDVMVSTNPPSPFTLDLYRMGYYVDGSWGESTRYCYDNR